MRILICDDDPLAIEQIHKNLKSFFTYKHIKCPEVISYSCGEDLLNDTGNKDIVFLDIEMPGMNGIYVGNDAVNLYHTSTLLIPVETKNGVHAISATDIIVVEAAERKVMVYTVQKSYESVRNMAYWLDTLPKSCFFQTHRSFIINLGHITDFDHTLIHLTNQLTAYLTRRKYRTFKDAYLLYLESMR